MGRCTTAECERLAQDLEWSGVVESDGTSVRSIAYPLAPPSARQGRVVILTSGTTGRPKAVVHTWETLARPARTNAAVAGAIWLSGYPLNLYAGLQVFLQAFLTWGTLVIPGTREPEAVARVLRDAQVSCASGTPTFWRQLLLFASRSVLSECVLRQITLGGEAASQDLLDRLHQTFPAARVTHVYATTELGRCFSVTDGQVGFPSRFLERPSREGVELRVAEGELWVRSRNAMIGYDRCSSISGDGGGWYPTGDLVEQRGDRIVFLGRRSEVINVGGTKVLPGPIEALIREIPGVADVKVYGRRSSLTSELVAADLVLAPGADETTVQGELARSAVARLSPPQRPRIVRVVPRLETSDGLKVARTARNR